MLSTIRTLRLEISMRGRPSSLVVPAQREVARDLDAPTPKELDVPSLEGGMLVVRIGKRSPKQWWLKDKQRKKPTKIEQRKV